MATSVARPRPHGRFPTRLIGLLYGPAVAELALDDADNLLSGAAPINPAERCVKVFACEGGQLAVFHGFLEMT